MTDVPEYEDVWSEPVESESTDPVLPDAEPLPEPLPLKSHRGPAVMTLGIIGLVMVPAGLLCCIVFAPGSIILGAIAWYMANQDLELMTLGLMDVRGRNQVEGGRICGIIAVIAGSAVLLIVLGFMGLSMVMSFAAGNASFGP